MLIDLGINSAKWEEQPYNLATSGTFRVDIARHQLATPR